MIMNFCAMTSIRCLLEIRHTVPANSFIPAYFTLTAYLYVTPHEPTASWEMMPLIHFNSADAAAISAVLIIFELLHFALPGLPLYEPLFHHQR
jgi:hypothetical protein